MAIDRLAKLGIVINSDQAKNARRDLLGLSEASGTATTATKTLTVASSALIAALTTGKVIQYADAYTTVTNRLKQATSNTRELLQAQSDVSRIAQLTLSDLDSTAQLYGKIGRASEELGITQTQVARTTETISKAIKLSGASATEADAAITQLAQGLASGVLRGEEFNSVAEQAPRLLEILKDELNATQGELRELASQGELTADVVIAAFERQSETIDREFESFVPTVEAGLNTIGTGFTELAGAIDQTIGASEGLANTFAGIGRILSETAEGIRVVTSNEFALAEAEKDLVDLFGQRLDANAALLQAETDGNRIRQRELEITIQGIDERIEKTIEERDRLRELTNEQAKASLEAKRLAQEQEEAQRRANEELARQYQIYGEGRQVAEDAIQAQTDKLVEFYSFGTGQAEATQQAIAQSADEITNALASGINIYAEALTQIDEVSDKFYEDLAQKAIEQAELEKRLNEERTASFMDFYNTQLNLVGTFGDIKAQEAADDLRRLKADENASDAAIAKAEERAKREFENNKKLNLGIVAASTGAAVMNELATNPDPVSKWLNVGTIISTGIAQAAKINAQQFGSSSSVGGSSGVQAASQQGQQNSVTNQVSIEFTGQINDFETVREGLENFFGNDGILFTQDQAQGRL